MNRLADEKSPYLQMHAENPVDWFPWGEEAFAAAHGQDKPVFLSIGYSSCHWCHVIAHESFEDAQVARTLNEHYISIKVDKEERPDVDAVYMEAVEISAGSGGWPMTLLLTPDAEPFFAATYLPKGALLRLLRQAAGLWNAQRDALLDTAGEFVQKMREQTARIPEPQAPDFSLLERAVCAYAAGYDQRFGGFEHAPKFPAAHNLLFLTAYYERTGDGAALKMAEGTLAAMARGGIFDHIGGGFSRYSVDQKWLVPHFEKMLYDNALLLWAYAELWRIAGRPEYRDIACRTADYVLREMTGPEGEFYCAQDADSAGREGAYYVFSRQELMELLGNTDGERFCDWYNIAEKGNFEGMSIPNRIGKDLAGENAMRALRERVYGYRKDRLPLNRDDKVLTAWNALMISALCVASKTLGKPEYLHAACRAQAFLQTHLTDASGDILLRWRGGEAKGTGVLNDFAYDLLALMQLYRCTQEDEYLRGAEKLAEAMLKNFTDVIRGGLYLYSRQSEQLIVRPKETWDAAMPSGNSCAALGLWLLARETGSPHWREAAKDQLRFVAGVAQEHPTGHGFGLLAILSGME